VQAFFSILSIGVVALAWVLQRAVRVRMIGLQFHSFSLSVKLLGKSFAQSAAAIVWQIKARLTIPPGILAICDFAFTAYSAIATCRVDDVKTGTAFAISNIQISGTSSESCGWVEHSSNRCASTIREEWRVSIFRKALLVAGYDNADRSDAFEDFLARLEESGGPQLSSTGRLQLA
jgi:hypothetical protein